MFGLGATELIVILVIILVIFGGSQLPKLAKSLGGAAKEMRDGFENGVDNDKKPTADKDSSKKD